MWATSSDVFLGEMWLEAMCDIPRSDGAVQRTVSFCRGLDHVVGQTNLYRCHYEPMRARLERMEFNGCSTVMILVYT